MENYTEILTLNVKITFANEVRGGSGLALMLGFEAECDNEYFTGKTLPGGVDTQREPLGGKRTLSARYMLEGTDFAGKKCRIFIENNAIAEPGAPTVPKILTDSEALAFLETAELSGEVEPAPFGVIIHINCPEINIPIGE